jgi:hypothetical protein
VPGINGAGTLDIASALLDVGGVYPDETADRCRFVFRETIDDALLKQLTLRLAAGSGKLSSPSAAEPHRCAA